MSFNQEEIKAREQIKIKKNKLKNMEEKVLQIIFNLQDFAEDRADNHNLSEGEYLVFSNKLGEDFKIIQDLISQKDTIIDNLIKQINYLRQTEWYKKNTNQDYNSRKILTDEQKWSSGDYTPCSCCDSLIKKGGRGKVSYMDLHKKRKKCRKIQLGREQSVLKHRPHNHNQAIIIGEVLAKQRQSQIIKRDTPQPSP
jgi:hypothetical protein